MRSSARWYLASGFALAALSVAAATAIAAPPATTAFVNVTVVPADTERVLPNHTVVVKGDRIVAMGVAETVKVPAGAVRIDGTGKFLVPGLAEMHGHIPTRDPSGDLSRRCFTLFVANGVTTVRDMQGAPGQLGFRDQIARGDLIGPRLVLYGPAMSGEGAPTPERASALVRDYKRAGFDGLNIMEGLSPASYEALARAAKQVKLPFGGHVPNDVGVERALALGQKSIEHLHGYVEVMLPAAAKDGGATAMSGIMGGDLAGIDEVDEGKIPALVTATKRAGAVATTTMVAWRTLFGDADGDALARLPELQYVPPRTRDQWARGEADRASNAAPLPRLRKLMVVRDHLLKALADEGLVMLAADAPQRYNVPGFSLRHETAAMVKAGMTPWQVLVAATTAPARYLHRERDGGTVAIGKRADLILIDGNPLEDVANLFRSAGVMANGRWLPRAKLDADLAAIAADLRYPTAREVQDFAIPASTAAALLGTFKWSPSPTDDDQTFRIIAKNGGLFALWSTAPGKLRRMRWQGGATFLVPEEMATITADIKDATAAAIAIKQDGAQLRWTRTAE